MARALRPCPVPTCPELTTGGRCPAHRATASRARGSAAARGYGHRHRVVFREAVLHRDPLCVCRDETHGHGPPCLAQASVADHYPRGRDELVAAGLDPDDPQYGRGICPVCHSAYTARAQPGGWHRDTASRRGGH